MLFVRLATTPGMRTACFPADEDADPASLSRAAALRLPAGTAWVAPAPAARQTAAAMGLEPRVVAALAEADCGRWRGLPYGRVAEEEPEALARWLADPEAAPHGGESLAAMAARVAGWLDTMRERPEGVVVCDVGVIRAALAHASTTTAIAATPHAPNTTALTTTPHAPGSVASLALLGAARFDLAPLSTTELTHARDGWRVAHVNRKVVS
ncbi:histidine phosphatase family protein [Nonomuraea sp. NPDC050643]|uniref:histidine phosphatase family protein n=1 Tax=Nonomuraea sp. NPDC050643 TaxID=3155660 RepID=UPI0033F021A9